MNIIIIIYYNLSQKVMQILYAGVIYSVKPWNVLANVHCNGHIKLKK